MKIKTLYIIYDFNDPGHPNRALLLPRNSHASDNRHRTQSNPSCPPQQRAVNQVYVLHRSVNIDSGQSQSADNFS